MAGQNALNQIRQAFAIPDSVVIVSAPDMLPPKPARPAASPHFNIDKTITADAELYRSLLGTPVYTNIEFSAGEYETNTKGVFKQYGPVRYEAVIITVSQAKKIIRTEIQGRNGTVKEYIGDDDYEIGISGIITGPNGHYPVDEVAALKKILDAPVAIGVACTFLQTLGIVSVVIDSYQLDQKEGGYSYQTFAISCLSDVPQELRLTAV